MPPLFTIITASLNNASTIRHTLKSIKEQKYQDYEHIVCDGGSVDNTSEILEEYEKYYDLVWLSEDDNGISEALNKGLKLAKGKYIYVLGADDYLIDGNVLCNVHEAIKDERYDIYSSPVIVNHPVRGKFYCKPSRFIWWHRFRNIFPHQGVFVHRRLYERVGNFSEKYSISMDYDFFYRALFFGCSVKFMNIPIALMGGTGLSSSKKYIAKRLHEEIQIQKSNERNLFWKYAQSIFWTLYLPYKTGLFTLKNTL